MRVDQVLREARAAIPASCSAALDAELLLAHVLGRSRTWLYTWPEQELTESQTSAFHALIARRRQGEPVAFLVGEREFYGYPFRVTSATLIPRPDTETLVDAVLEQLPEQPRAVADLGAGSGAIGISLALQRPDWQVVLVERSAAALAVAQDNARRLGAPVALLQSSWLTAVRGRFDAIVSNPPYIDPADPHLAIGDVRFEPRSALVAAERGLADLRTIMGQAVGSLRPGGWLALEHGHDQGAAVARMMRQYGYDAIHHRQDLAGHNRVTMGHV